MDVRYHYTVARFTPDHIRGEFINVGVVVWCPDTQEVGMRWITGYKRIRALGHLYSDKTMEALLGTFKRANYNRPTFWYQDGWREVSGLISFRQPMGGIEDSIEEAVFRTFEAFCQVNPDKSFTKGPL